MTGDPRSSLYAGDDTNLPEWVDAAFTPTCAQLGVPKPPGSPHRPWCLPSLAGKGSGGAAALSQHRHRTDPEGTLKMSPQPWPREDTPKLTHPEGSIQLILEHPQEILLLPFEAERQGKLIAALVLTAASHHPPRCGSCVKLLQRCVLLKRCILAAPFPAFISLLPSRCRILRSASALWFAFPPSYQPQTAAALPVWTEINPNLLCVSVGAELPLLSRLQMHSPVIQSSAYSQL